MMKKVLILLVLGILSAGCGASTETVQTAIAETQSHWTAVPTQTPYPTVNRTAVFIEAIDDLIIQLEKTIAVGENRTAQAAGKFTPTATGTLPPTKDFRTLNKSNGFFLVGEDIAPGVWRSTGTGDDCYWSITARDGDIIQNHFGLAGGTAYIPASAFQVEFEDCGGWEYLGPP